MEDIAKFNGAYAYVISEINNLLLEAGKPVASDNTSLYEGVSKASLIIQMLTEAIYEYSKLGSTEKLIRLQEEIINHKKNLK